MIVPLRMDSESEPDIGGDRRKGGIITLIKSNTNAYISSSSNDRPELQHTVTVKTLKREILHVTYYCPNNVNLELHNVHVRYSNFIIMRDFNSHSQSWRYDRIDARGEEIEATYQMARSTAIAGSYPTT